MNQKNKPIDTTRNRIFIYSPVLQKQIGTGIVITTMSYNESQTTGDVIHNKQNRDGIFTSNIACGGSIVTTSQPLSIIEIYLKALYDGKADNKDEKNILISKIDSAILGDSTDDIYKVHYSLLPPLTIFFVSLLPTRRVIGYVYRNVKFSNITDSVSSNDPKGRMIQIRYSCTPRIAIPDNLFTGNGDDIDIDQAGSLFNTNANYPLNEVPVPLSNIKTIIKERNGQTPDTDKESQSSKTNSAYLIDGKTGNKIYPSLVQRRIMFNNTVLKGITHCKLIEGANDKFIHSTDSSEPATILSGKQYNLLVLHINFQGADYVRNLINNNKATSIDIRDIQFSTALISGNSSKTAFNDYALFQKCKITSITTVSKLDSNDMQIINISCDDKL